MHRTKSKPSRPPFRSDILLAQLNNSTNEYIKKVSEILNDKSILAEFTQKVEKANKSMFKKLLVSNRTILRKYYSRIVIFISIWFSIIFLVTLGFYWDWISNLFFQNIQYDSKIIATQLTGTIALLSIYFNMKKKML